MFVSRKPPEPPGAELRTPHLPLLERPDGKPKLRPLSSLVSSSVSPRSLGHYAPPRERDIPEVPRSRTAFWLWSAALVLAIVFGALVAIIVVRGDKKRAVVIDAAPIVAVITPDAAPPIDAPSGPCLGAMILISAEIPFCIDTYEAPGEGDMPEIDVGLIEAETRCVARDARNGTRRPSPVH